jgi:NitT/TauT family transport system permease protein
MSRPAFYKALFVVLLVGVLELLCRTGIIDKHTMIPPTEMVTALFALARTATWFWPDVTYTLRNLVAAVALAVIAGFLGGLVVHAIPRLRRVLDPLFSSYYSVPTFVLYPMLIVIFGVGPASLIVMGSMFGVVAMLVSTLTAIDHIPRVLLKVARVSHLGPLRTAALIKLPAAAPHLFTGLKLAVAYSVIGVIAGEFILATAGVGRRIAFSYNNFENHTMYGMLLFILTLVVIINTLLQAVERRIHQRWRRQ